MNIVLGVTGCIAAYKAVEVLRQLQQRGAIVRVVMTRHACQFVGPVTFEALSRHPVYVDLFEPGINTGVQHVELARWADVLLVAPATANSLAKFAHGMADDFLSTLYLSARCPVVVAPAMDLEMWHHVVTQENLRTLKDRAVMIIEPERGYLASGLEGEGRLAEPETIAGLVFEVYRAVGKLGPGDLVGERFLITAGPTCEDFDPVRFITNRSTGKMGYALAQAAIDRGAEVVLVSGPTQLTPPSGAQLIQVRTADEMYQAVTSNLERATVVIKAAAVADYRPRSFSTSKIKKGEGDLIVALERTKDILADIGKRKGERVLVGFAAETEDLTEHGKKKLKSKKLDLIVVNNVAGKDQGFASDQNAAIMIDKAGGVVELPVMSKQEMAMRILDHIKAKFLSA
jgi:phosphopantothenoylcysteine decarboxylase/phosphopantothenate--cysteine ligase